MTDIEEEGRRKRRTFFEPDGEFDEDLLQAFVDVIDAELLEGVEGEGLKAKDVQKAHLTARVVCDGDVW